MQEHGFLAIILMLSMVGVAQWLRRQVVALEIEGSNPSTHPTNQLLWQPLLTINILSYN